MSVEKMNAYKEQKSHRKENLAKEKSRKKRNRVLSNGLIVLVCAAIVAAVGLTGYNQYKARQDALPSYDVTTQVVSDYAGVTETEAEVVEEEAAEEETAAEEAVETAEAESAAEETAEAAE